jgi:hypothetical protein
MKYAGCQKVKAFKLFDEGKRPSEIYSLVKVTKHTLYNYHQLWKREREEESKRKKLAQAHQRSLKEERIKKKLKQEEEARKKNKADSIRAQRRIQLIIEYNTQRKRVQELNEQMSKASHIPENMDDVLKIGEIFSQEYDKFRELTRKLYPLHADEKSIEIALQRKLA